MPRFKLLSAIVRGARYPAPAAYAKASAALVHAASASSVRTLKRFKVLGPKVVLIATSAASRPYAINTRPMRGVL
jgi:hypothetical protein